MCSLVDKTKKNNTANANVSSLRCSSSILVMFNYVWEQNSTQPTNSHGVCWTHLMSRTSEQTVKTAFCFKTSDSLNIEMHINANKEHGINNVLQLFLLRLYQPVCVTSQQIATLL